MIWLRRLLRLGLATVAVLALVACALHVSHSDDTRLDPAPEGTLRVATHNAHYIWLGRDTGPWSVADWEARAPAMDAAFKAMQADLVAYQEMESFAGGNSDDINLARSYLTARNPDYGIAAVGDWREFPSTQPIFYRRGRLSPVAQGWFFFSDTPDTIYARTFDGSYPAFASWVRFRTAEGVEFVAVNVHFEYRSGENRLKSAALVARRIRPWQDAGVPVILLGDLNARAGSKTVGILEAAGLAFVEIDGATYHFDRGLNLFGAIDHIAVGGGLRPTGPATVLQRRYAGEWPSDHYPVVQDLALP